MCDNNPLAGLESVPWDSLHHAYGTAGDVPEALLAIANGDTETAPGAVDVLFGTICHQGSVYEATTYAVPFLARMAVADMATVDLIYLLGLIAKSTDERHVSTTGSARAAVANQAGLLGPLLHSPEDRVRTTVAWTLSQSGPPEIIVPLMQARWGVEPVPSIRATLLRGLYALDPVQGTTLSGNVVTAGTAAERLVAAWVRTSAREPWNSDLRNAAMAWLAEGLDLDGAWWGDNKVEPFTELLFSLSQRGDMVIATELTVACLLQTCNPGVQKKVLRALTQLADNYRVPAAELELALVPLIADKALRGSVLRLLRSVDISLTANNATGSVLANALYDIANVRGLDQDADAALDCLITLGDPRATDLLSADLINRPKTLDSLAQLTGKYGTELDLGFDQGLLDAIRALLRTSSVMSPRYWPSHSELPQDTITHSMCAHILTLLASWGPQAAPAVPEITKILPHATFGARVLTVIGDPGPEAIAAVRTLAVRGCNTRDLWTRLTAASALRDLSGETGPLLVAIRDSLDGDYEWDLAAKAARSIDNPPEWLVPALQAAHTANSLDDEITRTLCWFTGNVSDLSDPLRQRSPSIPGPIGGHTVLEAAHDAGFAAEPLIPELAKFLDDAIFCPLAARAIMSAGLGNLDLPTLADHLVSAVGSEMGVNHCLALDLLRQIQLRDQAAILPDMLERLRSLAEQPKRIIRRKMGSISGHIREERALRKMICNSVNELGAL